MLSRWLKHIPVLRELRRAASNRRFESNTKSNLFRGIFDSFAAAEASAPSTRPTGYDNPASANLYLKRLTIDEYDYPSLFWISSSIFSGMRRIADIGGSVGIKYYAFAKFIDFPPDIIWRVIDVPAVVNRGKEFAEERNAGASLEFSARMSDAEDVDVMLVSGALQYLPQPLSEILDQLSSKPARIVINTAPIHPAHSFFTLNSIGTAYCPYRVERRDAFVEAITARGYHLRDEWLNLDKKMRIAFEPEYSLHNYTGFCFDAVDDRRLTTGLRVR